MKGTNFNFSEIIKLTNTLFTNTIFYLYNIIYRIVPIDVQLNFIYCTTTSNI